MFCFKSSTLDGALSIYRQNRCTIGTLEIKSELENDTCYHKVRSDMIAEFPVVNVFSVYQKFVVATWKVSWFSIL